MRIYPVCVNRVGMGKPFWVLYHILLLLNVISLSFQPSLPVDGPLQTAKNFTFHHPETEGKSSQEPSSLQRASLCPGRPSASTSSRRLSSPEKIIDLHNQLQKTLISRSQLLCTKDLSHSAKGLQSPADRVRGQEPRKYLSFSAPADLVPTPQRNEILSLSASRAKSATPSAAPSLPNKSPTFNNADAFQSAGLFTGHHFKTNNSDTHPETTASENSYFSTPYKSYGAAPELGRSLFAATCTPEKYPCERKSSAAVEKSKITRPKAGNTNI